MRPTCPKLQSYWTFDRCGYDKGSRCCCEPEQIEACPLPRHKLRNGRLNQTAYSLFFFVRDIAQGDIVGWIDERLSQGADPGSSESLIGPLRNVFGVSDKVLTMSLSTLLMGARDVKPAWFAVGAQMIAIDTLVHNFLHRTGILQRFKAEHAYGPRCYSGRLLRRDHQACRRADRCSPIQRPVPVEFSKIRAARDLAFLRRRRF